MITLLPPFQRLHLLFSYVIILVNASKTMLNHSRASVFSHLAPDFTGNASSALPYDGVYWFEKYEGIKSYFIEFNYK